MRERESYGEKARKEERGKKDGERAEFALLGGVGGMKKNRFFSHSNYL